MVPSAILCAAGQSQSSEALGMCRFLRIGATLGAIDTVGHVARNVATSCFVTVFALARILCIDKTKPKEVHHGHQGRSFFNPQR